MESHSRMYARIRDEQRAKEKEGYTKPETAEEKKKRFERVEKEIPKTPTEVAKMKIDRMMSQPDKPMILPKPPKELTMKDPREFNRHIMGSTAAAGSGEFHVYRATRRREFLRQDFMDYQDKKDKDLDEFESKRSELQYECDAATAKKRLKRQKQKQVKQAAINKARAKEMEKKRKEAEKLEEEKREAKRKARISERAAEKEKKKAEE